MITLIRMLEGWCERNLEHERRGKMSRIKLTAVAFVVAMMVKTRLAAMGTAFRPVGIRIVTDVLLVLLQGGALWQHARHRPVSFVVAISLACTTITEDGRPSFCRICFEIYMGMFLE